MVRPSPDQAKRVHVNLALKVETELNVLKGPAKRLALSACSSFLRGSLPEMRKEYKRRRKNLLRVAESLQEFDVDVGRLADRVQQLIEDVREAHTPSGSFVPILTLVMLAGSEEYFRVHHFPDPAAQLKKCLKALTITKASVPNEIEFIEREARGTKALWKTKPWLTWQKGTFEYVLQRLFRESAGLSMKEAHKRIIAIRQGLDSSKLKFDDDKGYCPAIQKRIRRLSREARRECDQVIRSVLKSPPNK